MTAPDWRGALRDPAVWVTLAFVASIFGMHALGPLFIWAFPSVDPPVYSRESFFVLFLSHAGFVAASSLISMSVGIGLAIFVTRDAGRDFRSIVDTMAVIGQTFPLAAVLALAVPMVGFGAVPTLIALTLYGMLPIIQNTIAGLERVRKDILEAAEGMGLSPRQRLIRVELPLAAGPILTGIRTSVIIGIGTATIGSTVGALTLGAPIISGLFGEKPSWVIQGASIVGLFAILTDMGFERLIRRLTPRGYGG